MRHQVITYDICNFGYVLNLTTIILFISFIFNEQLHHRCALYYCVFGFGFCVSFFTSVNSCPCSLNPVLLHDVEMCDAPDKRQDTHPSLCFLLYLCVSSVILSRGSEQSRGFCSSSIYWPLSLYVISSGWKTDLVS